MPRMGREGRHAAPERGQLAVGPERAEVGQGLGGARQGAGLGGLEPREGRGVAPAAGAQEQDGLAEVDAPDLGRLPGGPGLVVGLGPEAHAAAGAGAARAAGALLGRGAADRLGEQGVDAAHRVEAGDAGEAGVHDRADAGQRQRGLGDVGGDDHLAARAGSHRAVLLLGREVAMEGQQVGAPALRGVGEQAERARDLEGARHEDEDVALGLLAQQAPDLLRGAVPRASPGIARLGRVLEVDGEGPAVGGERLRTLQPGAERLGVEGGGHRHEQEVGAARLLEPPGEREGDVGVQVALMELVEDDRADAGQAGIGRHLPQEEGLGDELDAGGGGLGAVEADLVPHLVAQPPAALLGDARRQEPRGDAAGL